MMVLAAGLLLCVSLSSAQTAASLIIVSGNGQIVCPNCQNPILSYQPLVVMAVDANGNPVPGATINWAQVGENPVPPGLEQAFGTFNQSGASTYTTTTDATGRAQALFQLTNSFITGTSSLSVAQTAITATSGNATVTYYLSQGLQDTISIGEPAPISSQILGGVAVGQTFSGQIGTTGTTPIKIGVFSEGGQAVPNVAVFLVDAQTTGASIECSPSPSTTANPGGKNTVLTDSTGVANCYPTFGGVPGSGQFFVDIGGSASADPTSAASVYFTYPSQNILSGVLNAINFNVTPGVPGSIVAVSGTGQSANPGQALAQPLTVQVLNSSSQPLSGVLVTWSVSPANAAIFSATTTTGPTGQATNNVTLSSTASGTITISATASGAASPATFTITAIPVVTITSFSIVSGNNQSAIIGQNFANPLVVQVNSSAGPASGVPVHFQVQSGSVTLSATSTTTNASGQAQVSVQAGNSPGGAVVLATLSSASGNSSQTFNLNVLPQGPTITASNFYNAADLQPGYISPCGLGLIIGSSSLGVPNVSPTFPGLPAPQNTVAIAFNSIPAPILNISDTALGQQFILFQVPCTVSPGSSVPVTVSIGGSTSNVNLNVMTAAPGIFQVVQSDGVERAVIVRPDGSYATPTNPARRGETEIAYVTGLGATSPAVSTTALPVPGGTPATVLGTVVPGMAGGGVPLVSAQLSADLPGIYTVSFTIPTSESQGDVPFSIGIIPVGGANPVYTALTKVPVQ